MATLVATVTQRLTNAAPILVLATNASMLWIPTAASVVMALAVPGARGKLTSADRIRASMATVAMLSTSTVAPVSTVLRAHSVLLMFMSVSRDLARMVNASTT